MHMLDLPDFDPSSRQRDVCMFLTGVIVTSMKLLLICSSKRQINQVFRSSTPPTCLYDKESPFFHVSDSWPQILKELGSTPFEQSRSMTAKVPRTMLPHRVSLDLHEKCGPSAKTTPEDSRKWHGMAGAIAW